MKPSRKLALRKETLAELTSEELQHVAAGNAAAAYTGSPGCVISFRPPCVTSLCTLLFPNCIN